MDHAEHAAPLSRRRFMKLAGGAAALGGTSYLVVRGLTFGSDDSDDSSSVAGSGSGPHALDDFAANIQSGGVPKDGIPAIDEPRFVAASEAGFLDDDDVVFGIARRGGARAYPQLVLVWHEIVNDDFDGEPLSVTYCPLTGSAVGFRGVAPSGEPYTFGTSGDLVNSNLLMYDRQTDSRWPQILATAIQGPQRGEALEEIPLEWTTWRRWRTAFPETTVLSTETEHLRSYGTDPYGSYTPLDGYYRSGQPLFPAMAGDDGFPPKEVFVAAKHGSLHAAVQKEALRRKGAVPFSAGGESLAFLYDPELDEGRAFVSPDSAGATPLTPADGAGQYVDERSGSRWDSWGQPVGDTGAAPLQRIASYDVMWFAWVAFFPGTQVLG